MLDADNVAARADVQASNEAILLVDAIRQALHRLVVAAVHIGKSVVTDRTGKDDIEVRRALFFGLRLRGTHLAKGFDDGRDSQTALVSEVERLRL